MRLVALSVKGWTLWVRFSSVFVCPLQKASAGPWAVVVGVDGWVGVAIAIHTCRGAAAPSPRLAPSDTRSPLRSTPRSGSSPTSRNCYTRGLALQPLAKCVWSWETNTPQKPRNPFWSGTEIRRLLLRRGRGELWIIFFTEGTDGAPFDWIFYIESRPGANSNSPYSLSRVFLTFLVAYSTGDRVLIVGYEIIRASRNRISEVHWNESEVFKTCQFIFILVLIVSAAGL